jgi:hypothetical protein
LGREFLLETNSSIAATRPSFDECGRAFRLNVDQVRERNALALAALDAIEQIGDESEQRETLEYLVRVVDQDRLSDRPRFGS